MMTTAERISVIVPFYNAEETLLLCINALLAQTLQPAEIILVDNNSDDRSAEIAKKVTEQNPGVIIFLTELRQGPGRARNKGIRHSTGEIICFTDVDCIPEPDWLNVIARPFQNSQIGAVAGQIKGSGLETIFEKFHYLFTLKGLQQSELFKAFTLVRGGFPTANLAVRKNLLERLQGFDASMGSYGEDYDLCARIYQAGFHIQYTTGAAVLHKHRNTLKSTWLQSYGFGIGHAKLLNKHFKRMLMINLPRYQYVSRKWPVCIWIDLAAADKKLLFLVFGSILWWPLQIVIVFYLLMLYLNMVRRLRQNKMQAGFFEKWQLVFLLLFKSAAITTGRLAGMVKNKVLCV
jgi:GT2 family glycosyltransferase